MDYSKLIIDEWERFYENPPAYEEPDYFDIEDDNTESESEDE